MQWFVSQFSKWKYENGRSRSRSALALLLTRRRAYTGVHHFLYHVNNENSTGELFPPIPMFRLTIEFQSERKLFCLPPLGQVVELGTGLFKFTVEANFLKKNGNAIPRSSSTLSLLLHGTAPNRRKQLSSLKTCWWLIFFLFFIWIKIYQVILR